MGTEALFFKLDVRSDEDWQALYKELSARWQRLDVLINNAGVASAGLIEHQSITDWQWLLDINVMGVVRGCHMFTPMMKRQGQGHIINIASMAGLLHAPAMSAYNVSKAGVIALSETLLVELDSFNVGVSVVCPAFVQTNLLSTMRSSVPELNKRVSGWMGSSRITADDVAKATYKALVEKEFYVLTHRKEKLAWWLKRLNPAAFHTLLKKTAARQVQRMAEQIAA